MVEQEAGEHLTRCYHTSIGAGCFVRDDVFTVTVTVQAGGAGHNVASAIGLSPTETFTKGIRSTLGRILVRETTRFDADPFQICRRRGCSLPLLIIARSNTWGRRLNPWNKRSRSIARNIDLFANRMRSSSKPRMHPCNNQPAEARGHTPARNHPPHDTNPTPTLISAKWQKKYLQQQRGRFLVGRPAYLPAPTPHARSPKPNTIETEAELAGERRDKETRPHHTSFNSSTFMHGPPLRPGECLISIVQTKTGQNTRSKGKCSGLLPYRKGPNRAKAKRCTVTLAKADDEPSGSTAAYLLLAPLLTRLCHITCSECGSPSPRDCACSCSSSCRRIVRPCRGSHHPVASNEQLQQSPIARPQTPNNHFNYRQVIRGRRPWNTTYCTRRNDHVSVWVTSGGLVKEVNRSHAKKTQHDDNNS